MKTKTLQEQIDKFYKETGYQLKVKDGKPYWDGNLYLAHTKITRLPENLIVWGSLFLSGTKISELPENLVVGGSLDIRGTEITELPDNLVVGWCLDFEGSNVTELPENLVVGGSLDLSHTYISKLPDNFVVGDSLNLNYTDITKLPDNLVVGDSLYLADSKVTELYDNLVVGSCLYLGNSKVYKLPENLVVGSCIFGLSCTSIISTLTKEAKEKAQKIRRFLRWDVGNKTYIKVDGIFSIVDSHKGNIWITHRVGRDETLYVITDGEGHYAHGDSLKEAKTDLIYKINDRDMSSYEHLSLDDELSFEEAIVMYRTITGACSAGTKDFVESRPPKPHKERYTIREIIDLTGGEYGSEKLKEFFKISEC